jgi:hypothetical protein
MSIVAAISNVQTSLPPEITSQIQLLVTVSLVVSLSIALLSSDSKYWNRWASSTLEVCSSPLLITFAGVLAYKVMLII